MPIILVLAACGSADSASDFAPANAESTGTGGGAGKNTGGSDNAGATPSAGSSGSSGTNAPALPPEQEVESTYKAPVATGNVIWIANPTSGRVALIDAKTLQVRTVDAGDGPTYVASVPGQPVDTTLVINVNSFDATLLKANADGSISSQMFKTAPQLNSMSFSSDGHYAIVWADAKQTPTAPPTQGFQDLSILDLQSGATTTLAVGYRPVVVGFNAANNQAYAVTQDGISIVSLNGTPAVVNNVAIDTSASDNPMTRDVFVTKDGSQAFIRRDGSDTITIVSLVGKPSSSLQLSGPVTDLDVADTGDRAVAVIRDNAEADVISVTNPTAPVAVTVPGETIGSVSIAPGGSRALLYTNAVADDHVTVLNDLGTQPTPRTVRLYAPVLGVFPTPDANFAVVLHESSSASDAGATATGTSGGTSSASPTTPPPNAVAFSLVPIGKDLPAKIVDAGGTIKSVATVNTNAIIATANGTTYAAYLAQFPSLMVTKFDLATPPTAVGIVESANVAYVAQDHPEGRLTFIDLTSGVARTLTGFELSSRVVDGSKTP